MLEVSQFHASVAQRRVERGHAGGRPAVVQGEAVLRLDEVRADQARVAAVQEVERLVRHAGTLSTMSGYPYP